MKLLNSNSLRRVTSQWRNGLLGIAAALFLAPAAKAQVVGYAFSPSSATYTALSGATTFTINGGGGTADDGYSSLQPIGFTFNFGGASFTQFSMHSNGWLRFGATASATDYTPLDNTTMNNLVSFNGRDLNNSGAVYSYLLVGSPGSYICKIQANNFYRYNTTSHTGNAQVWLYEATGVVEIRYGTYSATWTSGACQVGIRTTSTDVRSVSSTTWAAVTAASASTSNTASITQGTTNQVVSGTVFSFTPPAPPACPAPTTLTATSITASGANLGWTNNGSATAWDLEIGTTGFTPTGTPTVNDAGTNPYTWTGGATATSYQFYVRADCGMDNVNVSAWSGPFGFTTACGASQTQLSLTTSGGSFPTEKWVTITTGINGTGTVIWAQGNGTYGNGAGLLTGVTFCATNGATYYINCYDLYADSWDGTTYSITAGATLVANNGGVSPDDGTDTDGGSTWENPPPSTVELESSEAFSYDPAGCFAPSALTATAITSTGANLGWTPQGTATAWDLEIGASGFTPTGTPTVNDVGSNPYTWAGGSANTAYAFYVRSDCGMNNTNVSSWSGPFIFQTACNAFSVPFQEGFNSTSTTEACWTVLNVNADADAWDLNYTSNAYEGNQAAMLYTDGNVGANDDWLISPAITLSGAEQLRYYYRVESSSEPNDMTVLLSTTGTAPGDFTTTLLPLTSYSNTTYAEKIISLTAYSGPVHIAWRVPPGGLDGWRLYVDNVNVEVAPNCPAPSAVTVSGTTYNSTNVNFSCVGCTGNVIVEYGPSAIRPNRCHRGSHRNTRVQHGRIPTGSCRPHGKHYLQRLCSPRLLRIQQWVQRQFPAGNLYHPGCTTTMPRRPWREFRYDRQPTLHHHGPNNVWFWQQRNVNQCGLRLR
jgi:hypothetical protein